MANLPKKSIQFDYPLNKVSIISGRKVHLHVGDLTVTGTAYDNGGPELRTVEDGDRFEVDIESITWNGMNILPVMDYITETSVGIMEEIESAAKEHAADEFYYSRVSSNY